MFTNRKMRWVSAIAFLVFIFVAVACRELLASSFVSNPIPSSAQSIARGKQLFDQHCQACHGVEGRGDGPAAATLTKRPDDLTRIAPPPLFPDGVVAYRIANGGDMMPAWKTAFSENQIWDLINFIRSKHRD